MKSHLYVAYVIIYHLQIICSVDECSANNEAPLILTDLIKVGKIEEAQLKAKVQFDEFYEVKSYAGYFTVNEHYNSNTFFWFFPSETHYIDAPVLLWLQGGPGASSMRALFQEHGPFQVNPNLKIELRNHRWSRRYSIVYIDNPVGTGYSFTNGGYVQNETIIGEHLYEAVLQFFQLFPELTKNKFFITGQSYAGKYAPALAYTILKASKNGDTRIRLQGISIGNAYSDPINQIHFSDFLYQIGLVDSKVKRHMQKMEENAIKHIQNKEWIAARNIFCDLIYDACHNTLFQNTTGFKEPFNYLKVKQSEKNYVKYIQREDVKKAIHVGNLTFDEGRTVDHYLAEDFMQSVAPWISEILSHYRIMFYAGQLDVTVPYPLIVNFLEKLNFSAADEYKEADRHKWYINGELAGYVKQAGNLTEVLVRNAGHMVPNDQPTWTLDMLSRFINNKPFY